MTDLKPVYRASSLTAAETALDTLEAQWGDTYPIVIKSWRSKWHQLSAYFKYPEPIRRIIYTTNAVEAVHRQFRKLTKTKVAFPNEKQLVKIILRRHIKCDRKMDNADPELGPATVSTEYLF